MKQKNYLSKTKTMKYKVLLILLLFFAGFYQVKAQTINLCNENSTQLNANLPDGYTGIWDFLQGNAVFENSTSPTTNVSYLAEGENVLRWTISDGQNVSDELFYITVDYLQANAGVDKFICENNTTLNGNLPANTNGQWSIYAGSGEIQIPSNNSTEVLNISTENNSYIWTLTKDYCIDRDTVNVTYYYTETLAGVGADALCGDEFELNALPILTGTGLWSVVSGSGDFDDETYYNTWVRNLSNGTNVLRWTVTNGICSNYDEITINNITPTQAVVMPDREICTNEVVVTANQPAIGEGVWQVISGSGNIQNPTNFSTLITDVGLGTNQFEWQITDPETLCSTSDTLTVLNNSIFADAGEDIIVCSSDGFESIVANNPQNGIGNWNLIQGYLTIENSSNYATIVSDFGIGENILTWTIINENCSYTDTLIIENVQLDANAGGDFMICENQANLSANTLNTGETGLWELVSGIGSIENPSSETTIVYDLGFGQNIFRWTVSNEYCSANDELIVNYIGVEAFAGLDMEVCESQGILFGNNPGDNAYGVWTVISGNGNIENPTSYVTQVTNLSFGANTFRWSVYGNGCSAFDEITIYNDELIIDAGENQFVNENHANLEAFDNYPGNGTWSVISGNGEFQEINNPITEVENLNPGLNIFRWQVDAELKACTETNFDDVEIYFRSDTVYQCFRQPVYGNGGGIIGLYKEEDYKIFLPMTVKDFEDISSYQYTIHWNPEILILDSVINFGLEGLSSENFFLNENGTLSTLWYDLAGGCQTLADDSVIYQLQFSPIGNSFDSTEVYIDGNPTEIYSYDCDSNPLISEFNSQWIKLPIVVSGNVSYYNSEINIANSELHFNAEEDKFSTTDSLGNYNVFAVSTDNFSIYPVKNDDFPISNGVTSLDIFKVQRHILEIEQLDNPYKIISADVNQNQEIESDDVYRMLKLTTDLDENSYPQGIWQFVSSDFDFSDEQNPFPFDRSRNYLSINDNFDNQDYIAIKLGDVDNSWENQSKFVKTAVDFYLGEGYFEENQLIIPLSVDNFTDIGCFQFSLEYNSENIELQSVRNILIDDFSLENVGLSTEVSGNNPVVWYSKTGNSIDIEDNSVIVEFVFDVISEGFTEINFGDYPTPKEIANEDNVIEFESNSTTITLDFDELSENNIAIYPNPCSNFVKVNCEYEISSISVRNILNQTVVKLENINSKTAEIQTKDFVNGVYIIDIELLNNTILSSKIIKY